MIIYALFALLAAVLVYPFLAEALRPRMNAARRKLAPGEFATLSQGITQLSVERAGGWPCCRLRAWTFDAVLCL